jgi:phosphoserine aminotransferase
MKPHQKPHRATFASGPCSKFPGWSIELLKDAAVSRSHRSKLGQAKINNVLNLTKEILEIPGDYQLALVPGSASGAMEMAIWNLVGALPLQTIIYDEFSNRWAQDVLDQLKLENTTVHKSEQGKLPDLSHVNCDQDVLINWNGSTSGVKIPDGEWISETRHGLVFCDVTSAAFTTELPWRKFDAVAFSWQKGLGGEAGHGMLALSPRAIDRINTYNAPWPIPYVFRAKHQEHFNAGLFEGITLNTPSLLCIEDFFLALKWAQRIGGLPALVTRSHNNFAVIDEWVKQTDWVDFLGEDPKTRSTSTICLKVIDPEVIHLTINEQWSFLRNMANLLAAENVAFDILNHINSPPSLRIWGGPTNEEDDFRALLPWLEWSFMQTLANDQAD